MLRLNVLSIIIFFNNISLLSGQSENTDFVSLEDTIRKKSHLNAFISTIAIDGTILLIDRYIYNKTFSRIDFNIIKRNFRSGFRWDNDGFQTNMFDHPAHGSFNYNSCRYNGLTYLESVPYSVLSSLIWEFFCENEPPSANDLISSSIGGLAVGEVTGRIAQTINAPYRKGIKRTGSEILSFMITPTITLQRLFEGQIWKNEEKTKIKNIPVRFQIGLGLECFSGYKNTLADSWKSSIFFNANYNDPFKEKPVRPFDHFKLRSRINATGNQPFLNKLNIEAVILGKKLELKNEGRVFIGIFQHYDFYDSDTISHSITTIPYKLAAPASYGIGVLFSKNTKLVKLSSSAHLSVVLTGATLTDHYNINKRNYNLGAGYSGKLHSALDYCNKVFLKMDFHFFHLFTWKGIPPGTVVTDENLFSYQGDRGSAFVFMFIPAIEFNIIKQLSLSIEMMLNYRKNHYKYFENVKKTTFELSGNIIYNF
ncbi:MAG: DUF3943 domain-containing protein [Deltaproteobacteria bacterium]